MKKNSISIEIYDNIVIWFWVIFIALSVFVFSCEKDSLNDDLSFSNQEYSSSFEQFAISELFRYSFENDLEGWIDGGSDCERRSEFASDGNYSIRLRDDTGLNASITSPVWDLSGLSTIDVTFSFYARSMEAGENFYVEFFNGSDWVLVQDFVVGTDFPNNDYSAKTITLNSDLGTESQIRFVCDASTNSDMIHLDNIILTGDDVIVIPPITSDTIFFGIGDLELQNVSGYPGWVAYRFIPRSPSIYGTAAIYNHFTQIVRSDDLKFNLCIVRSEYANYGNRLMQITRTQEGVYTSQFRTLDGFIFEPTDLVPGPDEHIVFIERDFPRSPAPGIPDFYAVLTAGFSDMPIAFVASKDFQTGDKVGLAIR